MRRKEYIPRVFWSEYADAFLRSPVGFHIVEIDGMFTALNDRDYLYYLKTTSLRSNNVPADYYSYN